ncbi:MAG TPA: hypothetical protein VK469_20480 [Candidatus Kapabacteria bacterium]|nr:hypothetical protein [Candidatus Kapabacteria bacterium]
MTLTNEGKVVYEEKDIYTITADLKKNRIHFFFQGQFDNVNKIPHYVEHSQKAVESLKKGFTILAEVVEGIKPPSITCTTPLKKSLDMFKEKEVGKVAVFIPKGNLLHKMSLNVVSKLSGLTAKVFGSKEEAEAWLDE